jgi:hypothetical protein
MGDDLASHHDGRFEFWSKGELARLAVIAGLAIFPISVAALDGPDGQDGATGTATARPGAAVAPIQPGRLRSVRVVDFDVGKLGLKAMGDIDDTVR